MVWNLDWKESIKDLIDSFDETCFEYWTIWIITSRDNWIWNKRDKASKKTFVCQKSKSTCFIPCEWLLLLFTLKLDISNQPWWSMSVSLSVYDFLFFRWFCLPSRSWCCRLQMIMIVSYSFWFMYIYISFFVVSVSLKLQWQLCA